jgi:ribosome maturation factor RimP
MDMPTKINSLIEPTLEDMGYELVRTRLSGDTNKTLQIMVERIDGVIINVDDCAQASRAISALLDVEDPISDAFTLEVSSAGIDRPLIKLKDFARFEGYEVRIEATRPIDGRRRFKGRITGVEGDVVAIATENGNFSIRHGDIMRAKLLMTDELISSAQKASQKAAQEAATEKDST